MSETETGGLGFQYTLEEAFTVLGYGKYQIILTVISGLTYLCYGYENGIGSYLNSVAACDLKMTTLEKGLLNATFIAGGMVSAVFWGTFADQYGRKRILKISLFVSGILTALASLSQRFWHLALLRTLSGITMCAPGNIILTYLSESLGEKYRAKSVVALGAFFSLGWLLLPLMSLLILPLKFKFETTHFTFNSWRLYLLCSGAFPTIAGIAMSWLHESPKFLLSHGRMTEALEVVQDMERTNCGHAKRKLQLVTSISCKGVVAIENGTVEGSLKNWWTNVKCLAKPPFRSNLILSCLLMISTMFGYYGLSLWLPEFFIRFNNFQKISSESLTLCELPRWRNASNETVTDFTESLCKEFKPESENYFNLFIMTVVCTVGNVVLTCLEPVVGLKVLIVFTGMTAGLSVFLVYFVNSPVWNLINSSAFLTLGENATMVIQSAICLLFPARISGLACSLAWLLGRAAAVVSNLFIGHFIDSFCTLPIFVMASTYWVSAFLGFLIPNLRKDEEKPKSEENPKNLGKNGKKEPCHISDAGSLGR